MNNYYSYLHTFSYIIIMLIETTLLKFVISHLYIDINNYIYIYIVIHKRYTKYIIKMDKFSNS